MGAVCCCWRSDDFEEYINPNGSVYRNCIWLTCLVQNIVNVYASLFRRGEVHAIGSSIQGATSLSSSTSLDNSDAYRSLPRPMPYDADPRYFHLQRDGLICRREKGSSHLHEESEPLRSDDLDIDSSPMETTDKWNDSNCDDWKVHHSKSSVKLSTKVSTHPVLMHHTSEDEDVCPTCLEEYSLENPKIVTKCSHHFHLACIYEWMERSENCPVCGKVMELEEGSEDAT